MDLNSAKPLLENVAAGIVALRGKQDHKACRSSIRSTQLLVAASPGKAGKGATNLPESGLRGSNVLMI